MQAFAWITPSLSLSSNHIGTGAFLASQVNLALLIFYDKHYTLTTCMCLSLEDQSTARFTTLLLCHVLYTLHIG